MSLKRQMVSVDSLPFCVYRSEPSDKPVMVLLHGGPGIDARYLSGLARDLASHFHVIYYDQRGDGFSECALESLNTSLEHYVEDLMNLLKTLDLSGKKVSLLGHSFGGVVAQKALALFPNAFDFGVLANTYADFEWVEKSEEKIEKLNIPQRAHDLSLKIIKGLASDADFKEMTILYAPLYYAELSLDEAVKRMSQATYRVASHRNALLHIHPNLDLKEDCKKITVPCLSIGGFKDLVVPWECQKLIAQLIPNCTFECLDDGGHFPWVKEGSQMVKIIIKAWQSLQNQTLHS